MLCSLIIEGFHNAAPFFSAFHHTFDKSNIFLVSPFLVDDGQVEMVEPAFPALFAVSKELPVRFYVKLSGYLVPLWLLVFTL